LDEHPLDPFPFQRFEHRRREMQARRGRRHAGTFLARINRLVPVPVLILLGDKSGRMCCDFPRRIGLRALRM
jgi:hypothetical protein